MGAATVRFFCTVGPITPPLGGEAQRPINTIADAGAAFLSALIDAGVGVRALNTQGGGGFPDNEVDPWWAPWRKLAPLFTAELAGDYRFNVVCVAMGTPVGKKARRRDLAPPVVRLSDDEGSMFVNPTIAALPGDPDELVYTPSTGIEAFHTHGRTNVLITKAQLGTCSKEQVRDELAAMRRYDHVVCPWPADVPWYTKLEVSARHMTPATFAMAVAHKEF